MNEYNKLWGDIVKGLTSQGYKIRGGNYSDWCYIEDPEGNPMKVFLKDNNKTDLDDTNHVIVRFS